MSNLLPDEAQETLVSTCRTAVGDSLRSITYFNRFDYVQVYLRDDLEQEADLNSFIGNEWHDFKMTQDAYRGSELGDYQYTIRVFENGYLVRITIEDFGVFVTTDGISMQDFEALASATTEILEDWAIAE
ncbi:hypothetical protein E6P09_10070 [Haloferax mediterranei ATCC 33500]|uniref:Uncharacterized protein n=1 Tax=Haloferax mediterranei (strain ATCC 33500 / DSM 1411 / JCM 8866 / NBRC 14739 / NCIMB 2177 / R-4) TaxID=523841 RepID=I3R4F9_HALMT|nr:hypothetical protein [Haloferax mediterranei]AFK19119.1 hypothetical protein HFX_1409 [Haloferax mediterranei ATCC 33500]AHZ21520.1 hypothetical protein BM92_02115 [Haloferax mediterranei ATCC 33500]EMA03980.1 hypothetical protein C439_03443 [Haloferax mediterranei ATCC 33500]MDX5989215.1 hypothetical protein [Haloferax mediterranei ATCC 33500]QCQ75591.1 hypothetical protein E6P09_10070 [Haloferax mediterranei ATCC 33500]